MKKAVLTSSLQDYLEAIRELTVDGRGARVTDIAKKLAIAKPSVTQAIATLKEYAYVKQDKYGPVILTKKGLQEAGRVQYRHSVLREFMVDVLDVDDEFAERDACLMEHVISPQTLEKLVAFIAEKKVNRDDKTQQTCEKQQSQNNQH